MFEISVIICAHNPRPEYLRRVLDALRNQTLPAEHWELLLIDNASEVPLLSIYDLSWHPHHRHVPEPEVGLAFARRRGIREARGELLVFVDDDNILEPSYLSVARRIAQEWKQLGVWGSGVTLAEFESAPQEYLHSYVSYLAIREVPTPRWTNVASHNSILRKDMMPWGAGLCVRANVAAGYSRLLDESAISVPGHQGIGLVGGDDLEISLVSCDLGFGIGIFPELKLTHLIPKSRIAEDYLINLAEGIAIGDCLLTYKWLGVRPRGPFSALGLLGAAKNVVTRRGIERRMYFAHWRAGGRAKRILARTRDGRK
jgi:Glycosyl transferase family 2